MRSQSADVHAARDGIVHLRHAIVRRDTDAAVRAGGGGERRILVALTQLFRTRVEAVGEWDRSFARFSFAWPSLFWTPVFAWSTFDVSRLPDGFVAVLDEYSAPPTGAVLPVMPCPQGAEMSRCRRWSDLSVAPNVSSAFLHDCLLRM